MSDECWLLCGGVRRINDEVMLRHLTDLDVTACAVHRCALTSVIEKKAFELLSSSSTTRSLYIVSCADGLPRVPAESIAPPPLSPSRHPGLIEVPAARGPTSANGLLWGPSGLSFRSSGLGLGGSPRADDSIVAPCCCCGCAARVPCPSMGSAAPPLLPLLPMLSRCCTVATMLLSRCYMHLHPPPPAQPRRCFCGRPLLLPTDGLDATARAPEPVSTCRLACAATACAASACAATARAASARAA